jgi:hypothetical protein
MDSDSVVMVYVKSSVVHDLAPSDPNAVALVALAAVMVFVTDEMIAGLATKRDASDATVCDAVTPVCEGWRMVALADDAGAVFPSAVGVPGAYARGSTGAGVGMRSLVGHSVRMDPVPVRVGPVALPTLAVAVATDATCSPSHPTLRPLLGGLIECPLLGTGVPLRRCRRYSSPRATPPVHAVQTLPPRLAAHCFSGRTRALRPIS